jgi:hypothetical protein
LESLYIPPSISNSHITIHKPYQTHTSQSSLSQQKKEKKKQTQKFIKPLQQTTMAIETNQPLVAKKVWNTVRIILFMLTKNIAKSKMVAELNLLLKRGKLAAVKAIANTLTLRHHHSATASSFVSPHDYEFSCNNSPAVIKFHNKNKNNRRHHHHQYTDFSTVQKVLEILNDVDASSFSSPSPLITFPGFGKSPIGKKIRVTDSPFPLKEEEGVDHSHVDVAAEEFIKRFYKNLNLQQKLAAIQSPYNNSRDR